MLFQPQGRQVLIDRPDSGSHVPDVRIGRILPSPPTQPFVGAVQHGVRGELIEDRHTKKIMPGIGIGKVAASEVSSFCCSARMRYRHLGMPSIAAGRKLYRLIPGPENHDSFGIPKSVLF